MTHNPNSISAQPAPTGDQGEWQGDNRDQKTRAQAVQNMRLSEASLEATGDERQKPAKPGTFEIQAWQQRPDGQGDRTRSDQGAGQPARQ